ncbi:hypothetical protein KR038_002848 [Drosophila bunnanda]|nr:hypothetical protein KR038_002848 [Drosophila bunnanda]
MEAMSKEEPSTSESTTSSSPTGEDFKSSNAPDSGSNPIDTTNPKGAENKEMFATQEMLHRNECNICLETTQDTMLRTCGHLFCWPCLYQCFLARPRRKCCPVCIVAVDNDKVTPIYDDDNTEDPPASLHFY